MGDLQLVAQMQDHEISNIVNGVEDPVYKMSLLHLSRLRDQYPDLAREDFESYIIKAQLAGANPLKEQVYLIPFGSKINVHGNIKWIKRANVIFSYHFLISKAEATGVYDGHETHDGIGDYLNPETKKVTQEHYAVCKVFRKDRSRPIEYKAWFPEFAKYGKQGLTSAWKKPVIMLTKCAVNNALKQAFPSELGFMKTKAEHDSSSQSFKVSENIRSESIETTANIVTETKEEVKKEVVVEKKEAMEEKKQEQKPYYISFGPMKGRDISIVPHEDLKGFLGFIEMESKKRDSISEEVKEFITKAKEVLKCLETEY